MKRRVKKPAVRPEVARGWLKRHDVDGESIPQIAEADHFDVRTVRRQIELMRQEREFREAKQVVLRQALEKHYVDLCTFAEKLRAEFGGDAPSKIPIKSDPMWKALREHLPRAPLWKDIDRWETLAESFDLSVRDLKARVGREASERTGLKLVSSPDGVGLADGLVDAIVFHLRSVARGWGGLKDVRFTTTRAEHGTRVFWAAYGIAMVPDDKVEDLRRSCEDLASRAAQWEEYSVLAGHIQEFLRLQRDVQEELTKIILRRVLVGRCVYCPF